MKQENLVGEGGPIYKAIENSIIYGEGFLKEKYKGRGMNKVSIGKAYLGDGVYINFNGWAYVLTAENGISATDTIYLEPDVIENLNRYVKRIEVKDDQKLKGMTTESSWEIEE
jgi:hypothetical protein